MSDEELAGLTVLFAANIDDLANAGAQIGAIFDAVESAAASTSADMTASVTDAAASFSSIFDAVSSATASVDEDVSQINAQVDSIAANAEDAATQSKSAFSGFDLGGMINQVGMSIFSLQAMGNMAVQTASSLLGPASAAENTQASFSNLLGSTQAAANELDQLNQFAAKTQFKTQDIDNMAASMIAFKTPTKDIIPELTSVGDALTAVGKGTPAEMQSVVDILGKIGIQGKLTQGDITQLGTHGINALDLIAEGSGKSTEEIQKMISKGTLPATDAINYLTQGIEKNPVYSGGMAKQSGTLSGQLSTLSSDWDQVMAAMMKPALPELESGLGKLTTLLTSPSFKQFATTVGKDIVTGVADLVTGVTKLVDAGEDTVKFFQQNQVAADLLLAILGGLGAGVLVFAAVQIPALVVGFAAWAVGAGAAAVATLAAAAPFIIVGAVVALAIFGIVEAVQHWGAIMNWIHGVAGSVAHGVQSAWSGMGAFFSGIGAAMWDGLKWGINQIIGGLDSFIDWLDSIHIDIPHIDAGPIQIGGGSIGLPRIPTIPLLASGGTVAPGQFAIAGEAGPELLYGGTSGMSVYSNSQSQAMMSGGTQHVHIYLDGREIANAMVDSVGNAIVSMVRSQGPIGRVA